MRQYIILYSKRAKCTYALTHAHHTRRILFWILYVGIKRYIIFLICFFLHSYMNIYSRKCIIPLYYTVSKYRCGKRIGKLFCFPLRQRFSECWNIHIGAVHFQVSNIFISSRPCGREYLPIQKYIIHHTIQSHSIKDSLTCSAQN